MNELELRSYELYPELSATCWITPCISFGPYDNFTFISVISGRGYFNTSCMPCWNLAIYRRMASLGVSFCARLLSSSESSENESLMLTEFELRPLRFLSKLFSDFVA